MLKNMVHETASGTTWPLVLAGPLAPGYRTVLAAFGSGKKALLTVRNRDAAEWETALYTVQADGSITRTAADVRDGSNGAGALVTFSAGIKDVICDADATLLLTAASKIHWGGTTGNSGNAYTVTVPEPVPTAYTAGMGVVAVINAANTGAATINVNGMGAKTITKAGSTALAAGDLPAGAVVTLTYDGTQFQMSSGAGASSGGWTVASKTAAYTVGTADKGAFLMCTGTWTLSLTAAATLGAGFVFAAKNSGSGAITLDPNGAETINGQATLTLGAGDTAMLICDGSGWHVIDSQFGGASPSFANLTTYMTGGTFVVPAGVYRLRIRCWGGGGGGGMFNGDWVVGSSGGTSSFGSICSATGGSGGGASSSGPGVGSGGSGSGGTVKGGGAGGSGRSGGGGGGGSAGGLSGSGIAGESSGSGYGAAGASGSGGAAGGARRTSSYGDGNPGTVGGVADSGGGGGGAYQPSSGYVNGGAGAAPGGGGGGGTNHSAYAGHGGGGGGYVEAVISVTPGTSYVVTVGDGGAGAVGTSSWRGGAGGSGRVTVEY